MIVCSIVGLLMNVGNRLRSDKMFLIMFPKFVGYCFINLSSMLSIRIYLAEIIDVFICSFNLLGKV